MFGIFLCILTTNLHVPVLPYSNNHFYTPIYLYTHSSYIHMVIHLGNTIPSLHTSCHSTLMTTAHALATYTHGMPQPVQLYKMQISRQTHTNTIISSAFRLHKWQISGQRHRDTTHSSACPTVQEADLAGQRHTCRYNTQL